MLVDSLELTEDEMDEYRASPLWPTRLAAAPTIPRECRVEDSWVYRPGQFDATTARTLLLTGSASVPVVREATERAAAAVPGTEIRVLDGHALFAHNTDPVMMTELLRRFLAA